MSDHIPDTGKMVSGKIVVLREIAAMLDHPNVYMGGPSQRNMRRAEEIYAAVAPLIAAAERERCAKVADEVATLRSVPSNKWVASEIAAAIRSLGDEA